MNLQPHSSYFEAPKAVAWQWAKYCLVLCPWLITAAILPSALGPAILLLLVVWAMSGDAMRGVQALTIQFFLLHLNPVVFGEQATGGVHHLLPLALLFKLVADPGYRTVLLRLWFVRRFAFLSVLVIAHSLIASTLPAVSIMKAVSLGVYATTAVVLSTIVVSSDTRKLQGWFLFVIAFTIVVSAPLLPLAAGTTRNSSGFNGILNHPNAMGVFLGTGVAYWVVVLVVRNRLHWPSIAVAVLGVFELYRSESRGGLLSCSFAIAIWSMQSMLASQSFAARAFSRLFIGATIMVPFVVVFSSRFAQLFESFISKSGRSRSSNIMDSFRASRGGAIEAHIAFFRESPIWGNGFQVVDTRAGTHTEVIYDPYWGSIPISASVENGFLYSSILAEGGAVGALVFLGLVLVAAIAALGRINRVERVIVFAVLLTNMTEATFFSTAGVGGWNWLLLSLPIALSSLNGPTSARRSHT